MECLYGYFINKQTSYDISIEKIKAFCDNANLKKHIKLFDELIKDSNIKYDKIDLINSSEVFDQVHIFNKINNEFKEKLLKGLEIQETKLLYNYYFIIYILLKWKKIAESRFIKMNKYKTQDSEILDTSKFFTNEILKNIESSDYLKNIYINQFHKISKNEVLIENSYNEILKKDKIFIEYCSSKEISDLEILNHLVKKIILKLNIFNEHFIEIDSLWNLTNSIIKNLILKTIKNFSTKIEDFKIEEIISIEELSFYKELVIGVIKNWDYFLKIFKTKIENWDLERLFFIDKILIIMAAYEIEFYKTPSKVSINEYIEISKIYSTPKSKKFINGVLDRFSKYLINNKN